MILVCGDSSTLRPLIKELKSLNADLLLWDPTDAMQTRIDLNVHADGSLSGILIHQSRKYRLDEISCVFNGTLNFNVSAKMGATTGSDDGLRQRQSVCFLIQTFIDNSGKPVFGPDMLSEEGKENFHLKEYSNYNDDAVYEKLITTSPGAAARFYIAHKGQVEFRSADGSDATWWRLINQESGMISRPAFCPMMLRRMYSHPKIQEAKTDAAAMAFHLNQTDLHRK